MRDVWCRIVSPKRILVMFAESQADADSWVSCIRFQIVCGGLG